MTADYTIVFDKLREAIEIETETARMQLPAPAAGEGESEEMREIDEIRRMAEELAEPDSSTFSST